MSPRRLRKTERRISAVVSKARCLAILDDVAVSGRPVVVTRRGRPVARLVPVEGRATDLCGSVLEESDLVAPTGETWEAES